VRTGGIHLECKDPELGPAIESLRMGLKAPLADVEVVAGFLRREETSLYRLKKAGLSPEVVEACFLLGHCGDSLVPERLERVRANPLARSGRIRELRARLERGPLGEQEGRGWDLSRESIEKALDFLENGFREVLFAENKDPCRFCRWPHEEAAGQDGVELER